MSKKKILSENLMREKVIQIDGGSSDLKTAWIKPNIYSVAASPSDEKAAKEEGRFSNGDSQSRHSPKEPKAQNRPFWWNTTADQPIPEQHVSDWLVL